MIYKALIFDFDGVITDTEPVHMEAWQSVLEPIGISFDEDEYLSHYIGLNDRDFLTTLGHRHNHHFDDMEKADLTENKLIAVLKLLEKDIPLLPGVEDFIEAASKKYSLAICSGSTHNEVDFVLRHLKWSGLFDPVITAEVVKKGKPDPEGYIRALEGIMERSSDVILPENVIAIEDSPKGIAAAKAAGISCLAVRGAFGDKDLKLADWIVDSLDKADFIVTL